MYFGTPAYLLTLGIILLSTVVHAIPLASSESNYDSSLKSVSGDETSQHSAQPSQPRTQNYILTDSLSQESEKRQSLNVTFFPGVPEGPRDIAVHGDFGLALNMEELVTSYLSTKLVNYFPKGTLKHNNITWVNTYSKSTESHSSTRGTNPTSVMFLAEYRSSIEELRSGSTASWMGVVDAHSPKGAARGSLQNINLGQKPQTEADFDQLLSAHHSPAKVSKFAKLRSKVSSKFSNLKKFDQRDLALRKLVLRFLNQLRYSHYVGHLDRTDLIWKTNWYPNIKNVEFIVDDDDYSNPAFQIHGTLATANSEDWNQLHAIHKRNRPRRE
ncbi:hypothetical protein EV368DRAFT_62075 [Lentinula lateritia]|nr:hypothetical protein EV368DRAFT_62075 [Lentinula lateritia]